MGSEQEEFFEKVKEGRIDAVGGGGNKNAPKNHPLTKGSWMISVES
jgi:hypothetical protein